MLKKINFTNKKGKFNPIKRNDEQVILERKEKAKYMAGVIAKEKTIIYLDETAIDETLVPSRSYAPAGEPFVLHMKPKGYHCWQPFPKTSF